MALNKKLTPIVANRMIKSAIQSENLLTVNFSDGSTMRIKTVGQVSVEPLMNRTVKTVRQRATTMNLDFSDNSTAVIPLAEATSSVMLRDKDNKLEYAD